MATKFSRRRNGVEQKGYLECDQCGCKTFTVHAAYEADIKEVNGTKALLGKMKHEEIFSISCKKCGAFVDAESYRELASLALNKRRNR